MRKKRALPKKVDKKTFGMFLLTLGIIGTFVLISPALTIVGVIASMIINSIIIRSWKK